MAKPKVYLAGPILGLTWEGSTDWRDRAAKGLGLFIDAYSPMRAKAFLKAFHDTMPLSDDRNPLSTAKGITTRDRFDVRTADAILVNLLGATEVSKGTMIELGWADAFRVPVVACMEDDNIHRHSMVDEVCGYIVPTLDEGIRVVRAILLPEGR